MKKSSKVKTVYVICADPEVSSCVVNSVHFDREYAESWVKKENEIAGFELYWVERSELFP